MRLAAPAISKNKRIPMPRMMVLFSEIEPDAAVVVVEEVATPLVWVATSLAADAELPEALIESLEEIGRAHV